MEGVDVATVKAIMGSDPSGFSALIMLVVFVILPAMWKIWNWSKETSAQGVLYSQLSEMVQKQRDELDELYKQRREDQEQIFQLRLKIDHLEEAEKTVEILKNKLNEKDKIIDEKDNKISSLLQDLLQMKDRLHNLELRLKLDEDKFCEGCQYKSQYLPPTVKVLNETQ